ncbi:hypothetical protein VTN77DRAFT_6264 [Rasamsonia byssochlamydoides]|uniref:uncharacterized protein n=1 Tax=Rasamsonia byssochlamydoides TaxID=89139 RepID=UPI0037440078
MDFWSRLIGGSRSLSSKSPRTTTPVERLAAFKRTCNTLQQIWRSSSSPSTELAATIHARNCIDRLNFVLSDESRGPAPHPCLAYASTSQIYVTVTKLALTYRDEDLISSAAVFFNTLIDAEVDGIVDSRVFSRALVDLVRRTGPAIDDVEGRLVELLFGVANNIRLQPKILPAWFAPKPPQPSDREQEAITDEKRFAGATRKDDFPLFYLLIDYVHREGRAGDFARTGLLYLIETATRSRDLEKWLIESDLATLMATGLGALYSQLSRQSVLTEGNVPTIIALSDESRPQTAVQPYLGADMDSFLSYLLFWQDTIDHCRSAEVNDTLLDHFQVLFLQQLLYPSLLESSDVEGGSTSAVLTYLYRMLEVIDQPELIHRILHYLLASPSESEPTVDVKPIQMKHMSVSRRKSLDLLAAFAEEAAKPSPSLFNLVDLILMSIKSQNRETVVATLRLVTVILRRHHSFAGSLIKTSPPERDARRTVGALNAELQQFISLATSIADDPTMDESYDNYLRDASLIVESRLFIAPSPGSSVVDGPADRPLDVRTDDPIFKELLALLESFFANSVVVNLALTEVITSLASSNLVSLDGWLLVEPSNYEYKADAIPQDKPEDNTKTPESGTADPLAMVKQALAEPTWSSENIPPIPKVLRQLVSRIEQWRREIPDFDILVAARRELLHDEQSATERSSRRPSVAPTTHTSMERPLQRARAEYESGSPRGRSTRAFGAAERPGSQPRGVVDSPLRETVGTSDSRTPPRPRPVIAEELRRRLASPIEIDSSGGSATAEPDHAESTVVDGDDSEPVATSRREAPRKVTLGHVLTNAVILYEFILELTALVQVRATLFEEAGYL